MSHTTNHSDDYLKNRVDGLQHTVQHDGYLDQFKKVHVSMFDENRKKVVKLLHDSLEHTVPFVDKSAIVLQGGRDFHRYDTDSDFLFKQESFFAYMFALSEPNCYGAIDLSTNEAILFIPRQSEKDAVWLGPIKKPEFYRKKYGVDFCYYTDEINSVLVNKGIKKLFLPKGVNFNSDRENESVNFDGIEDFQHDLSHLTPAMCEARVIKSEKELELMRFINVLSSNAHKQVMRVARDCIYERELESEFLHYINKHYGCRHVSYGCICCSGHNGAVLHYGHAGAPNDRLMNNTDMLLLDMGAEYYNYGSDITCSFPKSGKFTEEQKVIYNAVLDSMLETEKHVKSGVSWRHLQTISEIVIVKHLVDAGYVLANGLTPDELVNNHHLGRLFMPHSFGHLLGMDVHDVDSHTPHYPDTKHPGEEEFTWKDSLLRTGMIITVEPGIYFNEALLIPALKNEKKSRFLNREKIMSMMNFGGVRLEDDVVVHDDHGEVITKVPRTIEEIEKIMLV